MTTINAFDPRYVETYMPEFMAKLRKENRAIEEGKLHGSKSRVTREAANGSSFNTISTFPKTKASRINLEPRQYNTYSKAGVK